MKVRSIAIGAVSAAVLIAGTAMPASAQPISATIGGSSATVNTPLYKPGEFDCVKYPYTFVLEPDVNVATISILDGFGSTLASDLQLKPGSGTASMQVCGFQVKSAGPYTLNLEISYTFSSDKADQTAVSAPFNLSSRGGTQATCKKMRAPNKGQVKKFKQAKCPKGWRAA